jgi:replicative DNA helicase
MFTSYLKQKYERDSMHRMQNFLGYDLTKLKTLATYLDGIQPGLYIIGAETNVGKTAFLTTLLLDVLQTNLNVRCIYFSLDDSKDVIINRLLAQLTAIDINDIQKAYHLSENMRDMLNNFGYGRLIEWAESKRLNVVDMNDINSVQGIEYALEQERDNNMVICIDGIHNLSVDKNGSHGTREENIIRANALKSIADKYKIPVVTTAEVRKKDTKNSINSAPTIQDIMETSKFAYNAQVIMMLHPDDVHSFKKNSESIVQLTIEKNKLSSFKGSLPLRFFKNSSLFLEMDNKELGSIFQSISTISHEAYQY